MHTVQQILNSKRIDEIWSILPNATVYEAIQMLADKRVGALLVMEDSKLLGIISERDYAREVILKGRASKETRVKDIMSSNVITVSSTAGVQDSLGLMTNNRIRHLPVVDGGVVQGVISMGDLVKDIISDQQSTIEQLENYIRG
ncbi:MAG: CBS domain-containing protein [Proteobacteria bacterium]|nr:CBS domain-containing protein [Pseudomonadota bacterium]MDA0927876.1 CBS domain-containing protein [Pseudomonadota bacterium]